MLKTLLITSALVLTPVLAYAQDTAPAADAPKASARGAKFKECGAFYRANKVAITSDQKHNWMDFIKVCAKKEYTPETAMAKVATLP